MSQKEFQRVKVIENAAGGRLSVREASRLLQLSERQRAGRVLEMPSPIQLMRLFDCVAASRSEVVTPLRVTDCYSVISKPSAAARTLG
jgi:hypothetical protein